MAKRATPTSSASSAGDETNFTDDPAVLSKHYAEYVKSQRAIQNARTINQNTLKAAKKDGVDIDVLKEVYADAKREPTELSEHETRKQQYRHALGFAVQTSLFSKDLAPVPDAVRADQAALAAEQEGYDAGLKGRKADDHRFPAGTPTAAAFIRGHGKAIEFLTASNLLDKQTTTPPARGPRSRARGGEAPVH